MNNNESSCSITTYGSSTFLHDLQFYTISDGQYNNININKANDASISMSGTKLKCNRRNNNNNECLMHDTNTNLCQNEVPLNCDDIIYNTTTIDLSSTLDIQVNVGPKLSENTFWIEVIVISVGLSLIGIFCIFCFCTQIESDDYEVDFNYTQKKSNLNGNKKMNNNNKDKTVNPGEHVNNIKRKERILSDTENCTDNEYENENDVRFKQSLSMQIMNQEKLMNDVMKQMRRDSQHGLAFGSDQDDDDCKYQNENRNTFEVKVMKEDLNHLKVNDTLKEEPENSGSETSVDSSSDKVEQNVNKKELSTKGSHEKEESEFVVNV